MALKRPLVRDEFTGLISELSLSDSLPGAAFIVGTVTNTVSPASFDQAEFIIFDVEFLSTSKVSCSLAPNDDFDADDLEDCEVIATPSNGSILFTIVCDGPIVGDYKINYTIT